MVKLLEWLLTWTKDHQKKNIRLYDWYGPNPKKNKKYRTEPKTRHIFDIPIISTELTKNNIIQLMKLDSKVGKHLDKKLYCTCVVCGDSFVLRRHIGMRHYRLFCNYSCRKVVLGKERSCICCSSA